MNIGNVGSTLDKIVNVVTTYDAYVDDKSLIDASRLTSVEPLNIISRDLISADYMYDINLTLLNMFSAYYLQAISVLTKVTDVNVIRILDKLNPNRSSDLSTISNSLQNIAKESYEYTLPTSKSISLEAASDDTIKNLNEIANLSVGKLLNVDISLPGKDSDAKPVTIPINVRLLTSVLSNSSLLNILGTKSDKDFTERYHAWKAGRISFIKDLIFCQDLIDEYKRSIIHDETGTMQEIVRRVNNSKKFGLLTQNPSMASASNLFVITEEVAKELETQYGGKFTNAHIRNKLFENTYAMIIVVVDRDWERVVFYIRGINNGSSHSFKEIKAINKGKGPDIADMLKALNMGSVPSF
jgi:hypothetical protein